MPGPIRPHAPIDPQLLPPLPDCLRQLLQHQLRILPPNTGVRDADAVRKTGFAFFWDLLCACRAVLVSMYTSWSLIDWISRTLVDMTLNHNAEDSVLTTCNLARQISCHLRLVLVVLQGVAVAAVNH